MRDSIPANTAFLTVTSPGMGLPIYHLANAPPHAYRTVPPADLNRVDAVAIGLAAFDPGQTAEFSFKVRVNANATGSVINTGVLISNRGGGEKQHGYHPPACPIGKVAILYE